MAAVPETYATCGRHDNGGGEQSLRDVKKRHGWLRNEERNGDKKKSERGDGNKNTSNLNAFGK